MFIMVKFDLAEWHVAEFKAQREREKNIGQQENLQLTDMDTLVKVHTALDEWLRHQSLVPKVPGSNPAMTLVRDHLAFKLVALYGRKKI